MTPRTLATKIAAEVGQEMEAGEGPSREAMEAGAVLAEAGATAEVADLLLAELRRKRPGERKVLAYGFLLQSALDALRLAANGGEAYAGPGIEAVRGRVARALEEGGVDPVGLMLIARAFAQAGLDPGPALQAAMLESVEGQSAGVEPGQAVAELARHLGELAERLGGDPFLIHAEVAATAASFPPEHRGAMAAALAHSDSPPLREAALGFAFAQDAATAEATLEALAQPAGRRSVSAATLARLERMRPWMPEERRAGVDAALRTLRGPDAPSDGSRSAMPDTPLPAPASRKAARAVRPAPGPELRTLLATLPDGSGSQGIYAVVKQGRRFALAGVLVKEAAGVADAWVRDGMTRAEADEVAEEAAAESEAVETSSGLLEQRLADSLAVNVARAAPPPFGLLAFAEAIGLGPVQPRATTPACLAESLLAGLPPERTDDDAVRRAHEASARWALLYPTVASWFEGGEATAALLTPLKGRKRRVEAVLAQLLPGRRTFWAWCCAWTAATLKGSPDADEDEWAGFALVARDLAGGRPLSEIPLAGGIAAATVDAFARR